MLHQKQVINQSRQPKDAPILKRIATSFIDISAFTLPLLYSSLTFIAILGIPIVFTRGESYLDLFKRREFFLIITAYLGLFFTLYKKNLYKFTGKRIVGIEVISSDNHFPRPSDMYLFIRTITKLIILSIIAFLALVLAFILSIVPSLIISQLTFIPKGTNTLFINDASWNHFAGILTNIFILLSIILLPVFVYFFIFRFKNKRGITDILTRTRVVDTKSSLISVKIAIIIIFLISFWVFLGPYGFFLEKYINPKNHPFIYTDTKKLETYKSRSGYWSIKYNPLFFTHGNEREISIDQFNNNSSMIYGADIMSFYSPMYDEPNRCAKKFTISYYENLGNKKLEDYFSNLTITQGNDTFHYSDYLKENININGIQGWKLTKRDWEYSNGNLYKVIYFLPHKDLIYRFTIELRDIFKDVSDKFLPQDECEHNMKVIEQFIKTFRIY